MSNEAPKTCVICDHILRLTWTDTHGVSACQTCCSPYRSYKYTGEKREVVCESMTLERFVPMLRQYWKEKQKKIPHNFDFQVNNRPTYSGLVHDDYNEFESWLKKTGNDKLT